MTQCKNHPMYMAKRKPRLPCVQCWKNYFYALSRQEDEGRAVRDWARGVALRPGWVMGRRGPRQLGVYDG